LPIFINFHTIIDIKKLYLLLRQYKQYVQV
jgi:hypothetical protein